MKKVVFLLIAVFGVTAFIYAQDSTTVKLAQTALSAAEAKWSFVAKWATYVSVGLWVVSEILSFIPPKYIKANGVLQLVINWGKAIFGTKPL